jgi:cytochrome c biogenesis protein CcmG/thiol:disulfide interchange protein DsbE
MTINLSDTGNKTHVPFMGRKIAFPQWIILSSILLICGAGWIWYSRPIATEPHGGQLVMPHAGFQAPDFELQTLDGKTIKLSDLRGQAVIINIWATWCPPCRAEMPALQKVYEEHRETVEILAINATYQDSLDTVQEFARANNLSLPILLDENGIVAESYQLRSLPTSFFIDPDGIIQEVVIGGPMSEALLQIRAEQLTSN